MTDNRPFIETIAPTVGEAIARGLGDLGVSQDHVEVEILDNGDNLEGRQVRVRLTLLAEGQQLDETANTAKQILQELINKMRLRAHIAMRWSQATENEEAALILDLQGDDLSVLIGRRGETLTALQYLLRLIINKRLNKVVNVILDVEGYKSRREEQLQKMALRLADQAVHQGRSLSLEPMPANERRIVHLALRNHPDVITQSIGTGDTRKVTIIPKIK